MNEEHKRIIKNSAYMYLRMIFIMVISLYTSRIVLNMLGFKDFGIYTLVGGIVSIFTVLSSSLQNSVQRFLNFGIGRGDKEKTENYFTHSISIFAIVFLLFLIIGETIGLWFVQSRLNIPAGRESAVFWVYQWALIAVLFAIIQIPFSGAVIAREKMNIFAFAGIFDVCSRLIVVVLLYNYGSFDNLIVYSFFITAIQILITFFYIIYAIRNFSECKIKFRWQKAIVKEIMNFMQLSFFGNTVVTVTQQGINVILNIFFGAVVNAARGVAFQVNVAVLRFVECVNTPIRPQIVKSFAAGDTENMLFLFEKNTKYALFLMMVLCAPLITETRFVLNLWLKNVPDYAVIFTQLVLIESLFAVSSYSAASIINATGRLKNMEVYGKLIILAVLPLSYIIIKVITSGTPHISYEIAQTALSSGSAVAPAQRITQDLLHNFSLSAFMPLIPALLSLIAQIIYAIYLVADLRKKINLDMRRYCKNVMMPLFSMALSLIVVCGAEAMLFPDKYWRFLIIGFSTVIIGVLFMKKEIKYLLLHK